MESRRNAKSLLGIAVLLMVIGFSHGQMVNLTGPSSVVQGRDAVFICNITGIPSSPIFIWNDVSVNPSQQIFVNWEPFSEDPKYDNFRLSQTQNSTAMTILAAELEDTGNYVCVAAGVDSKTIAFSVEEDSPWFGHAESFIIIAALAVLLVASIIINISQCLK